jgi:dienelactone hydrolase
MDAISVHKDLKYSAEDHPCLLMDVYEAGPRAPVVLLVHGSAPVETRPKDWGIFQSWGRLLAASELTAATFNHRLTHKDVRDALHFVHAQLEAERVCLAVWSGGGPLLAVERPEFVRCVVAFYAILDCPVPDVPVFVARAGLDRIPGVNESINRFIREALEANAAVTLMNHPAGEHGFHNQNDDDRSREIIRCAIESMKTHLLKPR